MTTTYVTTEELSKLIKYDVRTIRERLKDSVLIEGRHYIRRFGGRKILHLWEAIEADMASDATAGAHRPHGRSRARPRSGGRSPLRPAAAALL